MLRLPVTPNSVPTRSAETTQRSQAIPSSVLQLSMGEITAFVAVVDHGSFTAAARVLHLSQPGVTGRVQRLERALRTPLIDRSIRRLTLTQAGHRFLDSARDLLRVLESSYL